MYCSASCVNRPAINKMSISGENTGIIKLKISKLGNAINPMLGFLKLNNKSLCFQKLCIIPNVQCLRGFGKRQCVVAGLYYITGT